MVSFKSRLLLVKVSLCRKANWKSKKMSPFKMVEKHNNGVPIHQNIRWVDLHQYPQICWLFKETIPLNVKGSKYSNIEARMSGVGLYNALLVATTTRAHGLSCFSLVFFTVLSGYSILGL